MSASALRARRSKVLRIIGLPRLREWYNYFVATHNTESFSRELLVEALLDNWTDELTSVVRDFIFERTK